MFELIPRLWFGLHDGTSLVALSVILLAITLLYVRPAIVELARYVQFTRHHDKTHQSSAVRLRAKVTTFFNSPWGRRTYYLSDAESIKRMLMSNSSLHAHALAEILHDVVWDVPKTPQMAAVDKMVHQSMAKGKISPMVAASEANLIRELERHANLLGKDGKPMPIHHMAFSIVYNSTMPAVLGARFPLESTRVPNQILANSMQGLNLASMLPIFPRSVWNRLIPAARRGVQARDAVKTEIAKWEAAGGVAYASEVYRNINEALNATGASPEDRACWINMVQFGFSGNTGESIGWILVFLLQSPKLYAEVMGEVNGLPDGSLTDLPLRQLCPHLDSAIHETLRYVGSVFSGRLVLRDVRLPGIEKTFSKGSIIRSMTRTASFDPSVWGHDAHYYRGDRFVERDDLLKNLQVFGGGVSSCPGRHFAMHELQLVTAHILRTFTFGPISFHRKCHPADPIDMVHATAKGDKANVIDTDGSKFSISISGFDVDKGVEAISGLLAPRLEPVAHMVPSSI